MMIIHGASGESLLFLFLVSSIEERPWLPTQKPNIHVDNIITCLGRFQYKDSCCYYHYCYNKGRKKKEKESERLTGERDKIKFIDLRFERWQVAGFRKARRRQDVP